MKKRRNAKLPVVEKGKSKSKESDVYDETEVWSGFGNGIPKYIFFDILLRLPLKSILICRYVCKTWREIVSDPEFAKLQYQNSQFQLMLRTDDSKHISRTLFLVEVELQELSNGCLKYGSHDICDPFNLNLDTKFIIPLRDAKNKVLCEMIENLRTNCKRRRSIIARPTFDKFGLVNSCNGLLCLMEPIKHYPMIICNPITGEFVKIPESPVIKRFTSPECSGFGFNQSTNQYKVVRMYSGWDFDPYTGEAYCYGNIAEVYTLGKGSWTCVGKAPRFPVGLKYPTYLNGAIHWLGLGLWSVHTILSFDFESELFQILNVPRLDSYWGSPGFGFCYRSMGVLKDCLCIYDHFDAEKVDIWVLNEYGVEDSWTNSISINLQGGLVGLFQVIKCYEKGAVLMSTLVTF